MLLYCCIISEGNATTPSNIITHIDLFKTMPCCRQVCQWVFMQSFCQHDGSSSLILLERMAMHAMLNLINPPPLNMESEGIITNCIKPYMLYSMPILGYQNDLHLIPRWQTSADCTEVFLWFATHLSLWRFRSFTSTSAEMVGSGCISVIQDGWSTVVQDLSIWFILPPPGSVHACSCLSK